MERESGNSTGNGVPISEGSTRSSTFHPTSPEPIPTPTDSTADFKARKALHSLIQGQQKARGLPPENRHQEEAAAAKKGPHALRAVPLRPIR